MMETYFFYLTVKLAAAAYLIYRLWVILFRYRLFGFWDELFPNPKGRAIPKAVTAAVVRPAVSVIGKTDNVILTDPRKAEPEPVAATDLEPVGFIGQEEPPGADEVDLPEPPYIPSEDELDMPPPDDNAMSSSGVSFQDLEDAVDVLKNGTEDETRLINVAKTLYDIQNTEIMEIFVQNVCRDDDIKNLVESNLDGNGYPLKKRDDLADFNIEDYI
jgi:hypothetical protein